jgi:hypothetical protein
MGRKLFSSPELRTWSCQGKSETLGVPRKREEIGCCYPMGEGRMIQFPSGQRLTTRPAVKSEGKPGNGSPKPDGIEGAGSVLSSEICIVVDREDILRISSGGKADSFLVLEGSSPECAMVSIQRHHRGLRPGHVLTGVARELGRSKCFLDNDAEFGHRPRLGKRPGTGKGRSIPVSERNQRSNQGIRGG